EIPPQRIEQARQAARILGRTITESFPFAGRTKPMEEDLVELLLNRAWRPQLAVVGMEGYPRPANAGNVLLPFSTAKLSMRLPPTTDARKAAIRLKEVLEVNPPHGAHVELKDAGGESGWNAPALAPWLEQSVAGASEEAFGRPAAYFG